MANSNLIFNSLLDNKDQFEELKDLSDDEVSFLKQRVSSLDERLIYDYEFHGVYHSQKVFLFGYLLTRRLGLSEDDTRILYDAFLLHDCGRVDEYEEPFHGLASANKLVNIFKNDSFYQKEPNLTLLRAIVDAHSVEDKSNGKIAFNYELDDYIDRFNRLCSILKDADALDRTRFPKSISASIKQKYLRLDYSKRLIDFAYRVNSFYDNYINNMFFEKYSNEFSSGESQVDCLHSIGWDFSKLEGILDYGILSDYSAQSKNISLSRNFKGNNSNMWISMVSGNDVPKDGKSFNEFIMNGLSFYVTVPKLSCGESIDPKARSLGLPKKSKEYDDESFAFYEVPKQDILALVCPKDFYDKKLDELDYLGCANSYSIISNRVDSYATYIKNTTGLNVDRTIIDEKIKGLTKLQLSFSDKNETYQRLNLKSFIETTDEIVRNINSDICRWMNESFRSYFSLPDGESPTVEMMINHILQKKGIDYTACVDSKEATIVFTNAKRKTDDELSQTKKTTR